MRWVTAIGTWILVVGLVSVAVSWPERSEPATVTVPDQDLCPGFLTVDPDSNFITTYQFIVLLPGKEPRRWVFASGPRCRDAWAPIAEALEKSGAGRVTECH